MPVDASDAEHQYFNKLQAEQRAKLRKQLDTNAKEMAEKEVAEKIKALGFEGESAKVFDLMPLVHVAWADGSIQRGERAAILKILASRNIAPGTEPYQLMETMLEEKPSDAFMNQSLAVLRELTGGLGSERSTEIVDLCIQVAASAGGFLGIGEKISGDEKAQIEAIVKTLGESATSSFQDSLNE